MHLPASKFHIVGVPCVEKNSSPQRGQRQNIPRAMLRMKPIAHTRMTIVSAVLEWIACLTIHTAGT